MWFYILTGIALGLIFYLGDKYILMNKNLGILTASQICGLHQI